MNVSMIDAWKRPGCGVACIPKRHDAMTHEAYGIALALMVQRVEPVRVVRTGALVVDLPAARATVAGADVPLSGREWAILACLASRLGQFVTCDDIIDAVWGQGYLSKKLRGTNPIDRSVLNANICRLRQKLGDAGRLIVTVTRNGYVGRRLEMAS